MRRKRIRNSKEKTEQNEAENGIAEFGGMEFGEANKQYLSRFPIPGADIDFVISPNEAVSPLDCERFPGSPFCGGLPEFEIIGIEASVSIGECEALLRLEPTIGFWKVPPFEAGVRWCETPALPEIPNAPTNSQIPLNGKDWCMYRVFTRQSGTQFNEGLLGGEQPFSHERDDYVWGPIYGVSMVSYLFRSWEGIEIQENEIYIYCHGWARSPDNPNFAGRGNSGAFLAHNRVVTTKGGPSVSARLEKVGFCLDINPIPYIPFFPEDKNMCNCKKIEADLAAIKKYLGVEKGGWEIPKKIRGIENEVMTINNFTDFSAWFVSQFAEMIGDTAIKIKVKDIDPLEGGNQEKTLIFDNLSQAIAELLGFAISNTSSQAVIQKTATNALLQAGQATVAASQAALNIEEIVDFLAYGVQEEEEELSLFFTPEKEDVDDFLQPSNQKITYRQMRDKQTFQSFAQKMLAMAAIYQALNSINPDGEDFPKMIEGIRSLAKGTDLNTFINKAEAGFPGSGSNPEATKPYGGDYSQRPRIKKWEGDGSDDGGGS